MKKKYIPFGENYRVSIYSPKYYDDRLLFTVEKKRKSFFGGVSWLQCFTPILIELTLGEDRSSCDANGVFNGRCQTIPIILRNASTFNPEYEANILYEEFKKALEYNNNIKNTIADSLSGLKNVE